MPSVKAWKVNNVRHFRGDNFYFSRLPLTVTARPRMILQCAGTVNKWKRPLKLLSSIEEKEKSSFGPTPCSSLSFFVQLSSCAQLFVTPWTATYQASLFYTNSWSLLKFVLIDSVMISNHLIFCHPLLLMPSIFPIIRVFQLTLYCIGLFTC